MGSWEWASGDSYQGDPTTAPGWQCILDHYYNDNGNATGAGGILTYRYSFIAGPGGDGQIAYAQLPYIGIGIPGTITNDAVSIRRMMKLARGGLPLDGSNGTMCGPGNYSDLYTMLLDGSNLTNITTDQCYNIPTWAPTQQQIAYELLSDPDPWSVWIINFVDGQGWGGSALLNSGYEPAWSRENVIAYVNNNGVGGADEGLSSQNPDGSGYFSVTGDPTAAYPTWSPYRSANSL